MIDFNIILPSSNTPHLRFFFQYSFLRIFYLYTACCMPCPSNDPWFHHSSNILWRTQSMKLKITQFSPSLRLVRSCHVIHHGTHLKGHVLPSGRDAKFHAYAKQWVNVMGSVHHTFNLYVSEWQPGRRDCELSANVPRPRPVCSYFVYVSNIILFTFRS